MAEFRPDGKEYVSLKAFASASLYSFESSRYVRILIALQLCTFILNFAGLQTQEMKLLYNIGIHIFTFVAMLISPFNAKARLWSRGRKGWESLIRGKRPGENFNVWMHCASLGEFEQGRPVIEAIKKLKPDYRIILTFFSPSGYEIRKNYSLADHVCYLPPDTPVNARKFISAINPACAIFVKYEFWHNYSTVLEKNGIPVYLISGIFRGNQHFFKWYGTFFRKILLRFSHIFVQDEGSLELLKGIGIENVTVAGDTRFDRVVGIADSAKPIPAIELFIGNEKVFLAGSSWRQDEEIIAKYINLQPGRMKWIFAPHEIDRSNIDRIVKLFDCGVVRFSELSGENSGARVLVIDNIGMLSAAYRYAYIAEVGGGFGKGIHNVLEAACWGIPVLFGPNYIKFREAVELIGCNGATSFSGYDEFASIMNNWLTDKDLYAEASRRAGQYVRANTGATGKILQKIIFQDINNPY